MSASHQSYLTTIYAELIGFYTSLKKSEMIQKKKKTAFHMIEEWLLKINIACSEMPEIQKMRLLKFRLEMTAVLLKEVGKLMLVTERNKMHRTVSMDIIFWKEFWNPSDFSFTKQRHWVVMVIY